MVLKRAIAISLTLSACSATANNLCELQQVQAEKSVKIQGVPGYFFKVHPSGDYVTFIEAEHNTMLDLKDGAEYPTVGTIDPVWSPDGTFMTHPGSEEGQGLQFYHGDKILSATKGKQLQGLASQNSSLGGVYQSIGKTDSNKYRLISDQNGVSIGAFEYDSGGMRELSAPTRPCANIQMLPTDIPMISKDGRFFSVYDSKARSTKIFKFDGNNCNLALDLGYGTGKVSFNGDSSQIAFHVDQFGEFENGYFSGVGKDKVKNIVVLNLDETPDGQLKPASWAMASRHTKPGDGGYYPDFDKNGNIYFMQDKDNNYEIVKVTQSNLDFRPTEDDLLFGKKHCVNCEGIWPEKKSAPAILADMWRDLCGKDALPEVELVMGIDPVACKEMVEKAFTPSLNISKEEVLAACPQKKVTAHIEVGQWNQNQKAQAESIIKGKCISCHRFPRTFEAEQIVTVMTGPEEVTAEKVTVRKKMGPLNLDKLDYKTGASMLQAILSRQMPKNDPLSDEERKLVTVYLQKKLMDMKKEPYGNDFIVRRYSEENLEHERQSVLAMNPDATGEMKNLLVNFVNCMYGQQNCPEYLSSQQKVFEMEATSMPEAKRLTFIQNKLMALKCDNLIGVTVQECIDWQQANPNFK